MIAFDHRAGGRHIPDPNRARGAGRGHCRQHEHAGSHVDSS